MARKCSDRRTVCRLLLAGAFLSFASAPWGLSSTDSNPEFSRFQSRYGSDWSLFSDAGTGRPRRLTGGSIPWFEESRAAGSDRATVDRMLTERARAFLEENAQCFGIVPDTLRPAPEAVISAKGGRLQFVRFEIAPHGVPVLGASVSLAVSRGNLIYAHFAGTRPVDADPIPRVSAGEALGHALKAAGLEPRELLRAPEPSLFFLPEGAGHRLIWQVVLIEKDNPRRQVARVDAGTGEVLALLDETVEGCDPVPPSGMLRRVLAGVRPERADEAERTELMPYALVEQNAAGSDGFFTPPSAPYSGRLDGTVAAVACTACLNPSTPLAPAGTDGDVDFGTGGTDAFGNGRSTPADRAAYFHAEQARRYATRWLSIPWFGETLSLQTNIQSACNANWDGNRINLFRSSADCSNTGEIRDIITHEWGHGLDAHDGLPPSPLSVDAATGEAVADIMALLRSRDACIGESFYLSTSRFPSDNCSGVRDLDEQAPGSRHGNPGTISTGNVSLKCGLSPFYRGPLGYEGHCEGEIFGQAFWHLVQNLLTGRSYGNGAPLPDGALSEEEAWQTAESLYFDSRPILACYAPSRLQNIGTSAYDAFLVADDEGDGIANGTPHAAAIHDAFLHHGIAESAGGPPDTVGCAAPPDPVVTAATEIPAETGLPAVRISWQNVGAASYELLRAEGDHEAYVPLEAPFGPGAGSYVDRAVLPGRPYYYRVVAASSGGCLSPGQNVVVGSAGPLLRVVQVVVDDASGNGNGLLDPGETVDLRISLKNIGSGTATNVRVSLDASDSRLHVLSGGPVNYGTISAGATVQGPTPFRVRAEANIPRFVALIVTAEASEGCFRDQYMLETAVIDLILDTYWAFEASGDGDGEWERGETADLIVMLRNDGLLDANPVTGTLSFRGTPVPGITIVQDTASWGRILGKMGPHAGTPAFSLDADVTLGPRTKVPLSLEVRIGPTRNRVFDLDVTVGGFPPGRLKWSGPPDEGIVHVTPLVLQLDDDDGDGVITGCDIPDVVVVQSDVPDGHLIAMSGDTGAVHWDLQDPCFNVSPFGAVAGGDINNDGLNEIVVVNQNRYVCAVSPDGSILWMTPQPIPGSTSGVSPVPQIWDLDGNGTAEIVVERTVLRGADGGVVWQDGEGQRNRDLVGDLNLDGRQEIITGSKTYNWNGSLYPASFAPLYPPGGLVNLDDDPYPEVVMTGGPGNGSVRAWEHDGTLIFERADIPAGPPGPACFADFDRDGHAELAVPYKNRFYLLDEDGSTIWSTFANDPSGAAGCSVFDFEGDGIPEIVYRDENVLHIIDGTDGEKLWEAGVSSGTAYEYPVVADVDGDGSAEIVVTGYADEKMGVHVYGSPEWVSARGVWNQEEYSVNHVTDTGGIVPSPAPRWLGANDYRAQAIACPCNGPTVQVSFTLPDCDIEDPDRPEDGSLTVCFHSAVAGGRPPFDLTWDFGDGSAKSTGSDPCHLFPAVGSYPVQTILKDSNRCFVESTVLVQLNGVPTVDFAVPAICVGKTSCFHAELAGGAAPFSFVWDFGDGSPQTAGIDVCHVFSRSATFNVSVFVQDAYGCYAKRVHAVRAIDSSGLPEVSSPGSPSPMRVVKAGAGLQFVYEDTGFETGIYQGDLNALRFIGYTHTATGACRVVGGTATIPMPAWSVYFLVVSSACENPRVEGSYGRNSAGNPRPSAAALGTQPCR